AYGIAVGLKEQRLLTLVLVGCLAFNTTLHSIYATRYAFLYSAHQTFLQVALVGLGLSHLAEKGRSGRRCVLAGLVGLLALESYYNLHFMEEIATLLETLS